MITNTELKSIKTNINDRFDYLKRKTDNIQSTISNVRWTERSIDYFGTTKKPHEAGYILFNGEMLDFSGGHMDERRLDHSEINFILTDEELEKARHKYRYEGSIQLFQTQSNAIRLSSAQYGGYAHITIYDSQLITPEQIKTLEYISNYDTPKHITYDVLNDDSRAVKYGEASSVSELKDKLDNYIDESKKLTQKYIEDKDYIIKKAKELFGTTKNPFDAGYIINDGTMLDFSRFKNDKFGFKEHSEISKIGGLSGDSPYDKIKDFINKTGSLRIRLSKEKIKDVFENEEELIPNRLLNQKFLTDINIEGGKTKINPYQWKTISEIYNNVINPYFYFGIGNKTGHAENIEELRKKLI